MTLIRVKDGTVNESQRKRMMHKSRRKIIDVLNNEYRQDTFGTYVVTRDEREEREVSEKKLKDEKSEIFRTQHSCPLCDKFFTTKLDRKFYYRTNHCFECQVEFESEMKASGLFLEWERMKVIQNELSIFNDHKQKFEEALNDIRPYSELVTDAGYVNKFEISTEQFNQIKEDIQDDLNFIEEKTPILIEKLAEIIESLLERDTNGIIAKYDIIFDKIANNVVENA